MIEPLKFLDHNGNDSSLKDGEPFVALHPFPQTGFPPCSFLYTLEDSYPILFTDDSLRHASLDQARGIIPTHGRP